MHRSVLKIQSNINCNNAPNQSSLSCPLVNPALLFLHGKGVLLAFTRCIFKRLPINLNVNRDLH